MRNYELVFVFDSQAIKTEKEAIALAKKLLKSVAGKVTKTDAWGLKDLAYPIEKHTSGWYLYLEVELNETKIKEFDKQTKLEEKVLRSLLIIK